MIKTTQRDIRSIGGAEEVYKRLKAYQNKNNTTGIPSVPSAYTLGLEVIGYSTGVYGCNGTIFKDIKTGALYGVAKRDYTIYIR